MNRFLKKICTGILCGVLGVVSIGAQEAFAADAKEMRAVWISTVYSADYPSTTNNAEAQKNEFIQKLEQAQALGLNTVVVQVRPKGDALYQSELNPWSAVLTGAQGTNPGYDPMAFMIAEAHKRGMEFHAWMNPYRITTSGTDVSALSADNMARKHPDWILTYNGAMYYDPANEEVQQYICDTVKEVVEKYDVDAIHFDDYFYPNLDDSKAETWFDYPEYQAGGTSLSVAAWRRNNVNELVRGVYSAVKSIRPQALFGISPEGYLQNLRKDTRQFTDVDAWMTQSGYVDYLMPQIYWGFEAKQNGQAAGYAFANCLNEWVTLKKKGNVKLYVGLALYKTGTDAVDGNEVPEWQRYHDIMKREVQAGRATGQVSGYCFYDLSSLTRAAAAEEVANVTALFH